MISKTNKKRSARAAAAPKAVATPGAVAAGKLAIRLFQSVKGTDYQDGESKWNAVLAFLKLPLCYQPAVQLVLATGRWKRARDPKAYVATVAYRRAIRENLLMHSDLDETRGRSRDEAGPVASFIRVGRNAAGESYNYDDQVDQLNWHHGEFDDYDEPLGDRVPDWLSAGGKYGLAVEWARVAEYAVRKKSMASNVAKVLAFMTCGMSRELSMETASDTEEREAIGAAWRWVDRNWKTRIVPLFHMDEPPAPVVKTRPPKRKFRPPWEALRQVHDRDQRVLSGSGK
jgi:hypothetical protein